MKKRMICFLVLIFMQCFFLPLVYAEDIQIPVIEERPSFDILTSELENEINLSIEGRNIKFLSRGGVNVFSGEVIRPKEIIITEEEHGTFKEGTKIYLSVKGLKLYEYISVETIQGDIVVHCEVTPNGLIEITILEESTQPSIFRIFNIAVNSKEDYKKALFRYPRSEEKTILYSYPLMLLAEDNNNVFEELEEDIELNSRFAVLQDFPMEPYMSMYYSKHVVVEKNSVTINDDKYFLSSSCYLKDGYYMVPLREMLGYIWNISDKNIIWDNETQSVHVPVRFWPGFIITLNTDNAWANGDDFELSTSAEIKDGVTYIAFRDYINITSGNISGIGDTNFYWDSDNFLVVFN